MTLQERLLELSARLRERTDVYARDAAIAARRRLDRTARQLESLDRPLDALALAGLKLNEIAAHYVSRLVTEQAATGRALVRGGAAGLHALAEADSLSAAWRGQRVHLVDAGGLAADSLRRTWDLTAATGREVAGLAAATYRELAQTGGARPRARRPAGGASEAAARQPRTARRARPRRQPQARS